MPNLRGLRHSFLLAGVVFLLGILGCDEEPAFQSADQALTHGGVEFRLGDYSIRYLELVDDEGETYEYPDPVFIVPLTLTNRGEDDLVYNPSHNDRLLSEAATPLLFPGPATMEVNWKEFVKQPISGVYLEQGHLDGQLQESATLSPGEEIRDLFIFELPDPANEILAFSLPPAMHRSAVPAFFRIDYREPEPEGPTVYDVGSAIEFEGLSFTVTDVAQTYIKLKDSDRGDGYSAEPVLKVSYTVKNETEETITFDPAHRDLSGRQGATLSSLHTEFNRVRFPSTATPEGQKERVEIKAGESIEDFAVFERPTESVDAATFSLAASHFDRTGRVRVAVAYEREDVDEPDEMKSN